jgi:hypothetical protein
LHLPDGYDAMTRALCQEEKRIFSGFSVIIAERIEISRRNHYFGTGEKPMLRKIASENIFALSTWLIDPESRHVASK